MLILILIIIIVFRFWDEDDYEHEIVSVLSSARAWASVSLAGKRDSHSRSRSHSTTSFSDSVVVAGTSYQILEVSTFCNRESAKPSPIKITALIFQLKNCSMKLSGLIFVHNTRKNSRTHSRPPLLVLKSKAGIFFLTDPNHDLTAQQYGTVGISCTVWRTHRGCWKFRACLAGRAATRISTCWGLEQSHKIQVQNQLRVVSEKKYFLFFRLRTKTFNPDMQLARIM